MHCTVQIIFYTLSSRWSNIPFFLHLMRGASYSRLRQRRCCWSVAASNRETQVCARGLARLLLPPPKGTRRSRARGSARRRAARRRARTDAMAPCRTRPICSLRRWHSFIGLRVVLGDGPESESTKLTAGRQSTRPPTHLLSPAAAGFMGSVR